MAGHPGTQRTATANAASARKAPTPAAKYHPVSDDVNASDPAPCDDRGRDRVVLGPAERGDGGDERTRGREEPDDRDDPARATAQHQHDAPGGQGDQGEGDDERRGLGALRDPGHRGAAHTARGPRPVLGPGDRRERGARQADQHGRPEGPAAGALSHRRRR